MSAHSLYDTHGSLVQQHHISIGRQVNSTCINYIAFFDQHGGFVEKIHQNRSGLVSDQTLYNCVIFSLYFRLLRYHNKDQLDILLLFSQIYDLMGGRSISTKQRISFLKRRWRKK